MSLFSHIGREARLILFISYLLTAGVVLRALGYIVQPKSQGALIIVLLGIYLVLLTIEQLAPFPAGWQHHLYFALQIALIATLLLLPPGFDFYAVLFFPLSTQALLNLPQRTGRIWIGIFTVVWTTIFVVMFGWDGLALSVFFAVGAIFFASFGEVTMQTLAANRQLADYAAEVRDLTIANERQRMARDLHDTLAQGLAGLILQLEAADSHLTQGNPVRAQAIVVQAMTRARTTLTDARRAIDDLRAGEIPPERFAKDVRALIDQFQETSRISVSLELQPLPVLGATVSETAMRAIGEALTNIAHHAHAHHVWIRLVLETNLLCLTIRDDGVGFFSDLAQGQGGHYGLLGLSERARLVGGALEITSNEGKGTTLIMRLPLKITKL